MVWTLARVHHSWFVRSLHVAPPVTGLIRSSVSLYMEVNMKAWFLAVALIAVQSPVTHAAPLYKCVGSGGSISYSDTPCAGAGKQAGSGGSTLTKTSSSIQTSLNARGSRPGSGGGSGGGNGGGTGGGDTPPPVVTPPPAPAPVDLEVFISSYSGSAASQSYIDGGLVRRTWAEIETSPGVYDWSKIDSEIGQYAGWGKKFSLALIAGPSTPEFYKTGSVVSFNNKKGLVSMPVPWDETYLGALANLMREAGKRYASHPNLRLVYLPQSSMNGVEGSFPTTTTPTMSSLGYTPALHAGAVLTMAEIVKEAFPNTRVAVELHEIQRSTEEAKIVMAGLDPAKFGIAVWWLGQGTYQTALQAEIKAWPGPKFMQAIAAAANEPDPTKGFRLVDYTGQPWGLDGIRKHTQDLDGVYVEVWPLDVTTFTTQLAAW